MRLSLQSTTNQFINYSLACLAYYREILLIVLGL